MTWYPICTHVKSWNQIESLHTWFYQCQSSCQASLCGSSSQSPLAALSPVAWSIKATDFTSIRPSDEHSLLQTFVSPHHATISFATFPFFLTQNMMTRCTCWVIDLPTDPETHANTHAHRVIQTCTHTTRNRKLCVHGKGQEQIQSQTSREQNLSKNPSSDGRDYEVLMKSFPDQAILRGNVEGDTGVDVQTSSSLHC